MLSELLGRKLLTSRGRGSFLDGLMYFLVEGKVDEGSSESVLKKSDELDENDNLLKRSMSNTYTF